MGASDPAVGLGSPEKTVLGHGRRIGEASVLADASRGMENVGPTLVGGDDVVDLGPRHHEGVRQELAVAA